MKKLTMKQRQALKNYQDVAICNDLLQLHTMRTNLWSAILRYKDTPMEKELQCAFNVVEDTFNALENYNPELGGGPNGQ